METEIETYVYIYMYIYMYVIYRHLDVQTYSDIDI